MQKKLVILVENIKIKHYVGVFRHEQHYKNNLILSARIEFLADLSKIAATDDLALTLSYKDIVDIIHETVAKRRYNLLETMLYDLLAAIKSGVQTKINIEITIKKLSATNYEEDTSITVSDRQID